MPETLIDITMEWNSTYYKGGAVEPLTNLPTQSIEDFNSQIASGYLDIR